MREGFWYSERESNLPVPVANAEAWPGKDEFLKKLFQAEEAAAKQLFKGYSPCRLCNKHCNGSGEFSLGGWVWPQGYLHCVEVRRGIAPQFTAGQLAALADGLRSCDERIVQGCTTEPPPLLCVHGWRCEKADAIGFLAMAANPEATIGEVEAFFAKTCHECDRLLGEPAACRYFLNWFDDTPRLIVFGELLTEVLFAEHTRMIIKWRPGDPVFDIEDFASDLSPMPRDREPCRKPNLLTAPADENLCVFCDLPLNGETGGYHESCFRFPQGDGEPLTADEEAEARRHHEDAVDMAAAYAASGEPDSEGGEAD